MVCLTGMSIQGRRMREILREGQVARRHDRRWRAVGDGRAEEALDGLADVIFVGEADETWPQFLRDWEKGCHKSRYVQEDKTDHDARCRCRASTC